MPAGLRTMQLILIATELVARTGSIDHQNSVSRGVQKDDCRSKSLMAAGFSSQQDAIRQVSSPQPAKLLGVSRLWRCPFAGVQDTNRRWGVTWSPQLVSWTLRLRHRPFHAHTSYIDISSPSDCAIRGKRSPAKAIRDHLIGIGGADRRNSGRSATPDRRFESVCNRATLPRASASQVRRVDATKPSRPVQPAAGQPPCSRLVSRRPSRLRQDPVLP
jgi:hypothetical protein